MIYDLVNNYGACVHCIIEPSKSKDGFECSHNGIDCRGSSFIFPTEFRTTVVNASISFWQSQGEVGAATVSPFIVPAFSTYDVRKVPRWTLDQQNGIITAGYFVNVGMLPSVHGGSSSSGWKTPAMLTCCDDVFVMPHADHVCSTYSHPLSWDDMCRGGIWAGRHAEIALEKRVKTADRSQKTNFSTVKCRASQINSFNNFFQISIETIQYNSVDFKYLFYDV